ncbi:hypothetical protein [Stenotrophomonas maltophilia]|uniref:hypothetical protein n=1 Tax=Stenotrophomonas maltophilia TaxID=40324 RepID=UPI000F66BE5F|nr:hypothetical protein [Stenotrophomonas maltophilia]
MKFNRSAIAAVCGPVFFAGANLALSVALQQSGDAADFGAYAFIQVVVAASMGISNGLFGIPLISATKSRLDRAERGVRSLALVNIAFCATASTVALLLAFSATRGSILTALLAASFCMTSGIRWFLRLQALAELDNDTALKMDVIFGIVALAGAACIYFAGSASTPLALITAIAAAVASLAGCSKHLKIYVTSVGIKRSDFDLTEIRRRGLSAVSVSLLFEAIATAPAYYISLTYSTAAYAPVALAILFFRPYGVLLTAAMQYQRPRVARALESSASHSVTSNLLKISILLAFAWALNSTSILAVASISPHLIYRTDYQPDSINTAFFVIGLSVLAKAFREPIASVLLVSDQFRKLGIAAAFGATATLLTLIAAKATSEFALGTVLSSILIGELTALTITCLFYVKQFHGSRPQ